MGLFKKKVQDTVTDAVGVVKDIAAKATAEKMDVWGDAAKIGIFTMMAIGLFRGNRRQSAGRNAGFGAEPDVRTMTVNNYYYGYQPRYGRKKNDRTA